MDYYKDLKREDFASDNDYFLERFNGGLAAGFTFQQCPYHQLIYFALALGLSKADILEIVGPNTGYMFPDPCPQHRHDWSTRRRRDVTYHWKWSCPLHWWGQRH